MFTLDGVMGKDKQVNRARKSRRKVLCITCDKSMSWEFFRNNHKHKRHGGKNVPVRVISDSQVEQGNVDNKSEQSGKERTVEQRTSTDVRNFFKPIKTKTKVCKTKLFLKI